MATRSSNYYKTLGVSKNSSEEATQNGQRYKPSSALPWAALNRALPAIFTSTKLHMAWIAQAFPLCGATQAANAKN